MEWSNSEMSFFIGDDNIIFIKVDKDVKKLTVPAAKECVEKLKEAMNVDEKAKVLFFFMPEIYVSKDVIRCYADTVFGEAGITVYCKTFGSWLIGNIAVTIRKRFMSSNLGSTGAIKAFKKEEEAIEWSLNQIKNAIS